MIGYGKRHDHYLLEGCDDTIFFFTRDKEDITVNFITKNEESEANLVEKVSISPLSDLHKTLCQEFYLNNESPNN